MTTQVPKYVIVFSLWHHGGCQRPFPFLWYEGCVIQELYGCAVGTGQQEQSYTLAFSLWFLVLSNLIPCTTAAISSIMIKVEMAKDILWKCETYGTTDLKVPKLVATEFAPSNGKKKNHICKCIAFAISTFTIKEEMASANSMLCTIFLHNFLCDGIASFKPHCMSVIQLIDNIVSDSMIHCKCFPCKKCRKTPCHTGYPVTST